MFPEVLKVLLDRVPKRLPATVTGWRVAALPDRVYPGLVPAKRTVKGLILDDLTPQEWRLLDAFEDEVYELQRVELADGHHGWAYVCDADAQVHTHDWDPEEFVAQHLARYVDNCVAWRRRHAEKMGSAHRATI
jgi:gamma-glutamylcyclotransferase (GGCT)/AIG2-like uncharacterized protein YtfP